LALYPFEDGSELLYDHERDPLERTNLASDAEFADVKASLAKWLPQHDEPRTKPLGRKRDSNDN
jgi:hypothetical protein